MYVCRRRQWGGDSDDVPESVQFSVAIDGWATTDAIHVWFNAE